MLVSASGGSDLPPGDHSDAPPPTSISNTRTENRVRNHTRVHLCWYYFESLRDEPSGTKQFAEGAAAGWPFSLHPLASVLLAHMTSIYLASCATGTIHLHSLVCAHNVQVRMVCLVSLLAVCTLQGRPRHTHQRHRFSLAGYCTLNLGHIMLL